MHTTKTIAAALMLFSAVISSAQKTTVTAVKASPDDSLKNISLSGLSFRSIGPAITGGRVIDIAVNPRNSSEYFVASGHGSLWKTSNNGTTFSPVFDAQPSFAMGSVRYDPSNPNNVWVGTGENNGQGNAIYGDGIYKSEDGGKGWKNMGLQSSEHIGGIAIDPTNSNVVYAAAYGSLRKEGGDRGVYKTTDGGKTWRRVLYISEYTGCYEVHMDPRNNMTLYAVSHERFRKGYTNIQGGPESAIYRSLDSGATWQKIMKGMPTGDIGRMGMCVSSANPDVLYAIVQAKEGAGVYKSTNRGASWNKQSGGISAYPFYMQKLFADPKDENRVYSMDLLIQVSADGGKTFKPLGEKHKHVDNHVLWIDPSNTKHLISGNDGGVYESWDLGQSWSFKSNIPIAEVYKVSTDNALPFYNVYIGTQDNNSLMGPSRTINSSGITNREWTFTLGGDGFQTRADWKDDNILYVQSQNGGLVRYDKKNGEQLFIQPVNLIDSGYRFDWDAPLIISRHDNKRLYFAANKLFRTNDRGNTWDIISPDLTRGVPQKMLRLMNKSWSIEEYATKGSLANISSVAESPLDENIIYAGTGDGLIQVTTDGGKTWSKATSLPGVTEFTRVHHILASQHNKLVAYASCYAYNAGDYKPYLLKTNDGGKTWVSINANLPAKGSTYCMAEDHVKADLLFAGTQFGLYVSVDGGKEWIKFMNGLPTTTIMDMEIQRKENDLVVSTFGRGVYILDDYTPLRYLTTETLRKKAEIFPIKEAWMYIEGNPFGFAGKGFQGANFYSAANPPVGATFTYFIKDEVKSLKDKRKEEEKKKQEKGEDVDYPSYDVLFKEGQQPDPYLLFTVTDEQGNVIRKIKTQISKGVNRLTWDFRYQPFTPVTFTPFDDTYAWNTPDVGYMVTPGTYKVSLSQFEDGKFTELVSAQSFKCVPLNNTSLPPADKATLDAFNKKVADLTRAMSGADAYRGELVEKIPYLKQAVLDAASVPTVTYEQILAIENKLKEINRQMNGDGLRARYESVTPISLKGRVDQIAGSLWVTTSAPTETFKQSYNIAADGFEAILNSLKTVTEEIKQVETVLEKYKAPYTPGRLPDWKKN
ncbi:MAG: glycosyl hydrolase [Sphingobacteriales bacterium]|nr:glycosyl hydrolase [Sphingobacteriales bacterium]